MLEREVRTLTEAKGRAFPQKKKKKKNASLGMKIANERSHKFICFGGFLSNESVLGKGGSCA